jgi:hypothetical protein
MLGITGFNVDGFLEGIHVFFNSDEVSYLGQMEPTSTFKNLSSEKYSF